MAKAVARGKADRFDSEENDEDDENNHKGDVDDVHRSGWQAWAILHLWPWRREGPQAYGTLTGDQDGDEDDDDHDGHDDDDGDYGHDDDDGDDGDDDDDGDDRMMMMVMMMVMMVMVMVTPPPFHCLPVNPGYFGRTSWLSWFSRKKGRGRTGQEANLKRPRKLIFQSWNQIYVQVTRL